MIGKKRAVLKSADENLMRRLGAVNFYGRSNEELRKDGIGVYAGPSKNHLWWPLVEGADEPLPRSPRC